MFEFSNAFQEMLPLMILKIGVALVCGILLGIEREIKDKPAGLRTMVLITVGSTLYMIVSELIPLVAEGPESITRADPSRIAAQVVTGIGFLGAGAIIRGRGSIHGLTTAAVIWIAAGIGLCVGAGFPILGFSTTIVVLITLILMDPLRRWLSRRAAARTLRFRLNNDELLLRRVEYLMEQFDVREQEYNVSLHAPDELEIEVSVRAESDSAARFLDALTALKGVRGLPARES